MFRGSVRVPAIHSIRQFPIHFPSRASPCAITFQMDSTIRLSEITMVCPPRLIFWHRSFTFNSNKSPTWCNNFSVYYRDVCLQLNVFRAFSRPSSGAQWLQWQPLVLPSYRGDSRAVNKRQDNKLKNYCIRLVIYFNCTTIHGLTSLKFYI
jgi:hypothetical protein